MVNADELAAGSTDFKALAILILRWMTQHGLAALKEGGECVDIMSGWLAAQFNVGWAFIRLRGQGNLEKRQFTHRCFPIVTNADFAVVRVWDEDGIVANPFALHVLACGRAVARTCCVHWKIHGIFFISSLTQ